MSTARQRDFRDTKIYLFFDNFGELGFGFRRDQYIAPVLFDVVADRRPESLLITVETRLGVRVVLVKQVSN